ncbi:MAG: glycoside hydrolase family 19 protein [Candidatus Accumulibacter propinquus]|jgi:hypothetical protein|uniref:glycoside hydrolase family 19 protein n=1 Tax=Candidatus Accumulibacter propinquus TaxID=2954380 RepID=UPI002FC30FA1
MQAYWLNSKYLSGSAYYNPTNGNSASDDGHKYKGRGLLHLTWKNNYRRASNGLNDAYGAGTYDLVNDFISVSENPIVAARTAAWYWKNGSAWGNLNSIVDRVNYSDQINFEATIRGVRGGGDPPRVATWNSIRNTIYGPNSYGNMGKVLSALGITAIPTKRYHAQFGVSLNKMVLQRCPAVILAEAGKLAHETASAPLYADNGIV